LIRRKKIIQPAGRAIFARPARFLRQKRKIADPTPVQIPVKSRQAKFLANASFRWHDFSTRLAV
jgi:hypothetical protein